MNRGFIFAVILATGGFAIGYGIGHRHISLGQRLPADGAAVPAIKVDTSAASSNNTAAIQSDRSPDPVKLSPAELESKIRAIKTGDRRGGFAFAKILDLVDASDFARVLEVVRRNPSKSRRIEFSYAVFSRWGETDPHAGVANAMNLANKQERISALSAVVGSWVGKDSQAAVGWVQQLPAGTERNQVLNSLLGSLASVDPQAAFTLSQSSGPEARRSFYALFYTWADRDPYTAVSKAAELTGQQRSQAFQAIASTWAAKDPQSALLWANQLPNGMEKRTTVGSIISVWAQTDPTGAMVWVRDLPEGAAKQAAMSNLGVQWAQSDAKAALAFAQTLTAGTSKSLSEKS